MKPICKFLGSTSGAITFDWLVLIAVFVGLGVATLTAFETGLDTLSSKSSSYGPARSIASAF